MLVVIDGAARQCTVVTQIRLLIKATSMLFIEKRKSMTE